MPYVVKAPNGIKSLQSGRTWAKGSIVTPGGFPPDLWQALLDEESVVWVSPPEAGAGLAEIAPGYETALRQVGVNTAADLREAAVSTLTSISGVGPATAEKWKAAASDS